MSITVRVNSDLSVRAAMRSLAAVRSALLRPFCKRVAPSTVAGAGFGVLPPKSENPPLAGFGAGAGAGAAGYGEGLLPKRLNPPLLAGFGAGAGVAGFDAGLLPNRLKPPP